MTTIKLLDARRGLNLKCRELFNDEKIAELIYRYLCDGIEECENAEPERKTGKWKGYRADEKNWQMNDGSPVFLICSECENTVINNGSAHWYFCPNCGAKMEEEG